MHMNLLQRRFPAAVWSKWGQNDQTTDSPLPLFLSFLPPLWVVLYHFKH
jgi:hypothetical protein